MHDAASCSETMPYIFFLWNSVIAIYLDLQGLFRALTTHTRICIHALSRPASFLKDWKHACLFVLFSSNHYQETGSFWRLKTIRKGLKTVRNTIPDGQPSGTSRQEPIVRKDPFFLTAGRQEYFPDGSSRRSVWGWKRWLIPDGWTVRKPANEAKKK